jgi:hypothetical protein
LIFVCLRILFKEITYLSPFPLTSSLRDEQSAEAVMCPPVHLKILTQPGTVAHAYNPRYLGSSKFQASPREESV